MKKVNRSLAEEIRKNFQPKEKIVLETIGKEGIFLEGTPTDIIKEVEIRGIRKDDVEALMRC